MGVVIHHCASGDIGSKLSLTLSVECLVEVILPLIKPVFPQGDGPAAAAPHSKVINLSSVSAGAVWLACCAVLSRARQLILNNAPVLCCTTFVCGAGFFLGSREGGGARLGGGGGSVK